jgi:hypothetical protein
LEFLAEKRCRKHPPQIFGGFASKKTAATIDYPAAKKPPQILISDCFLLAFPTAFGRRKC